MSLSPFQTPPSPKSSKGTGLALIQWSTVLALEHEVTRRPVDAPVPKRY